MDILLIIDMQEGFRFSQTEALAQKLKNIPNDFSGEIIFSYFKDVEGSNFDTKLGWKVFQKEENRRIITELKKLAHDKKFFEHTGYSVLTQELESYLSDKEIDKIFLCGIYTDVCVLHTALELFDKGYEVRVIADYCASPNDHYNDQIHSCALETIRHAIGKDNVILAADLKNIL